MTTKVVTKNRKARYDYFLGEIFEAGIVLTGSEIKSIRAGQISISEAYVQIADGEVWLIDAHIAPYDHASVFNHEPKRRRKLLLNRAEIKKLWNETRRKGTTIIPTQVLLRNGWAKVEIATAIGKKKYDKRMAIAKRDMEREIQRQALKRDE